MLKATIPICESSNGKYVVTFSIFSSPFTRYSVNSFSFASKSLIRPIVSSNAASIPATATMLGLAGSSIAGIVFGIFRLSESLPVPPAINGLIFVPFLTKNPLVPNGPYRFLCPAKAIKSAIRLFMLMSNNPND